MSTESFGLPGWSFILAVVLLAIGFIIAIILSWIYDIHPEGGMVKTEPADKDRTAEVHKTSNNWKIASYISFAVIVALIVLNIIPRSDRSRPSEILDKSIAVLPFYIRYFAL
jgi:Mn2+/Fe2+ NRAMP family transporter